MRTVFMSCSGCALVTMLGLCLLLYLGLRVIFGG